MVKLDICVADGCLGVPARAPKDQTVGNFNWSALAIDTNNGNEN